MKSVLIVEEDDDLREALKELLELYGYEVEQTSSGHEALTLLAARNPHPCVLVDAQVEGGAELLEEISSQGGAISAIAFSAVPLPGVPNVTVLRKPFDPELLLELVKQRCRFQ